MKQCNVCGLVKPLTEYHKRKDAPCGVRSYCKKCHSDKQGLYAKTNKEAHRVRSYRSQLKKNYGLSVKDFNALYEKQHGVCDICGTQVENIFQGIEGYRVAVDHCHKTGKVRGLLCNLCNSGIGKLKDDPYIVRNALHYLEKHEALEYLEEHDA